MAPDRVRKALSRMKDGERVLLEFRKNGVFGPALLRKLLRDDGIQTDWGTRALLQALSRKRGQFVLDRPEELHVVFRPLRGRFDSERFIEHFAHSLETVRILSRNSLR